MTPLKSATFFIRTRMEISTRQSLRKLGPLEETNDLIGKNMCPGCLEFFKAGDHVTLVAFGPGNDEEEQAKARECRFYDAVAICGHWSCVTGEP